MGIASCTGGPRISFLVGRNDSSTANPTGQIPSGSDSAATLITDFTAKGFTSTELVALVGAHSVGKNLSGTAFDSSVDGWDTTFYGETLDGSAPASLASDQNLAADSITSAAWTDFAGSLSDWTAAFVPA
jgi:manganese peroxidase